MQLSPIGAWGAVVMSAYDTNGLEQQARDLGACLRSAAEQQASAEHFALEGERLRRAISQLKREPGDPGRLRRGHLLVLAAATAVMVVALFGVGLWRMLQIAPLTFDVIGPGRVSETYVASPPNLSTLLKFSDGSTVQAHPNARLRVPEVHADGATLMLDSGRATVSVVHRHARSHWTVVAGPYAITVVGTRFDVEWHPHLDKLTIDMSDGQVEVGGPKIAAPVAVRASQHFEASADAGWAVTPMGAKNGTSVAHVGLSRANRVSEVAATESSNAAPRAESLALAPSTGAGRALVHNSLPVAASAAVRGAEAVTTATVASSANPQMMAEAHIVSWSKLVARGEPQRVIAEAEAMGQKSCFSQCSSADLRALADAARYSGRLDMAEAALRAVRERFPAQAPVAAYLLATVDEARGRNASAMRWYESYLAEAPKGSFLSEALAGRLRMLVATNGYTSARKAARDYLELFPSGVGAKTATQVLQSR